MTRRGQIGAEWRLYHKHIVALEYHSNTLPIITSVAALQAS